MRHGTQKEREDVPSRRISWRLGTPVVLALCGAMFITTAEVSDGNDLRPNRWTDMQSLVRGERATADQLTERLSALNAEVDQRTAAQSQGGSGYTRRIKRVSDPAGFTPVQGPGVVVVMDDAPASVSGTGDGNDLVVHQQDLQAVVNALWDGGAEAVTLMGQRLISTTGIKCEGNVVTLHGIPYAPPYRIEAVGDPQTLQAALDNDQVVTTYRQYAADPDYQVGWETSSESLVKAPAYEGVTTLQYASPMT